MARKLFNPAPPNTRQVELIIRYLSKGAIPATAAARAGVSEATLQHWLRMGAAGEPIYREFVEDFDQALIEFECKILDFLESNSHKNANTAQWIFLLRFGPKYRAYAEAEAKLMMGEPVATQKEAPPTEAEILAAERRLEMAS